MRSRHGWRSTSRISRRSQITPSLSIIVSRRASSAKSSSSTIWKKWRSVRGRLTFVPIMRILQLRWKKNWLWSTSPWQNLPQQRWVISRRNRGTWWRMGLRCAVSFHQARRALRIAWWLNTGPTSRSTLTTCSCRSRDAAESLTPNAEPNSRNQ